MANKKVKKAAPKQAKARARRAVKRTSAKARAASKPQRKAKKMPVKARKAARPEKKAQARKALPRKAPPKSVKKKSVARPAAIAAKPKPAPARRMMAVPPPPTLQRERRRLPEAEEDNFTEVSDDSRLMSSARAGHDELRSELKQHTESSPELTAGDVDAKWQDAYALGDEAPGGDNMTPDQDRVDDIGKALGIEYADDEELQGGQELVARDEHRWELDPASKEDEEDL